MTEVEIIQLNRELQKQLPSIWDPTNVTPEGRRYKTRYGGPIQNTPVGGSFIALRGDRNKIRTFANRLGKSVKVEPIERTDLFVRVTVVDRRVLRVGPLRGYVTP